MNSNLSRSLRFGVSLAFYIDKVENVDVLILAGDIAEVETDNLNSILEEGLNFAKHVIYVPGNHDFYYTEINAIHKMKKSNHNPNIHILYNDTVRILGKNFFGGTMWGEISPQNEELIRISIKDFALIDGLSPATFRYEANIFQHSFLSAVDDIDVAISHFSPCFKSIPDIYKGSPINDYYVHEMSRHFTMPLWVHGHTHTSFDYTVDQTRVVCNPFGYMGTEVNREFKRSLTINL